MPPSPAEIAAYQGLHAAAQRGDTAGIERLLRAAQSPRNLLEARDGHGRTPPHVATFARQRDAVKALLAAGADSSTFEDGRYDAVTIAAVADDEETLRVVLAAGASAKLTTSRYDGTALIAAGANTALTDRDGRTALQLARARLRRAGAVARSALGRRPHLQHLTVQQR